MGGESEAAWRAILDDLTKRGLKKPELAIVDGAPGLEKALVSLWSDLAIQRCTVHKLRNLIAHAPKRLAEEIAADYTAMIYAKDAKQVEKRRKAFVAKWRDKCEGVATSLPPEVFYTSGDPQALQCQVVRLLGRSIAAVQPLPV